MKKQSKNIIVGIIALLFSACQLVAESYDKTNSWSMIVGSNSRIIISSIKFIIISIFTIVCVKLIYYIFSRFKNKKEQANKIENIIFDKYPKLLTTIILIVFWIPNYIFYFPGVLTYDAIRQYKEFFSQALTNHHPVLTTIIEAEFVKLGMMMGNQQIGIALYLILVLVVTTFILSIGFSWMKKRKVYYIVRWMMLVFFCILPIWSAYARTVVKDSLFYPVFFLYTIFFFDFILAYESKIEKKTWIKYIACSLCLPLVRHNGWYVVIGTLLILLFWCKKIRKKIFIISLFFLFLFKGYNGILLPRLNVADGGKQEMLSIPFQQTARYIKYYRDEVTDQEKKSINKVLDYNHIWKVYNPNLSDPVKGTYKKTMNI
ncbi:MAG: DUF6020 family protein [Anaerostipes sp.]|nr:DUF6020 family protein [Anaerostipes sp.]